MPDQFYADPTKVTLGEDFSTDFRYLRRAIATPLVTYLQAGPTLRVDYLRANTSNPKLWAYKCGPYELRVFVTGPSGTTPAYPTNAVVAVAL